METARTEAYDPTNEGDLTQRAWALAWQKMVERGSMEYDTATLVFEEMVYHERVRLIKRHFPKVKTPERPLVWGMDFFSKWAFNALAAHYKKWDKEFTREEKEQYELFYQRMVRSFGHRSLFIFPLGAHQLTVEKEYRDAQEAALPEEFA